MMPLSARNNPAIHLSKIDGPAHMQDFAKSADHVEGNGESTQWGLTKE